MPAKPAFIRRISEEFTGLCQDVNHFSLQRVYDLVRTMHPLGIRTKHGTEDAGEEDGDEGDADSEDGEDKDDEDDDEEEEQGKDKDKAAGQCIRRTNSSLRQDSLRQVCSLLAQMQASLVQCGRKCLPASSCKWTGSVDG